MYHQLLCVSPISTTTSTTAITLTLLTTTKMAAEAAAGAQMTVSVNMIPSLLWYCFIFTFFVSLVPEGHHRVSLLAYSFHSLLWFFILFVTSVAHLMAIWPFLPSSFSYVKDLVVHLAPQCLFPNWGVSLCIIRRYISLLIHSSIIILFHRYY